MSYEDAAILAAVAVPLALVIALLPRSRRGDLMERPEVQILEFDPLVVEEDGPVLDLKPA